MVKVLFVGDSTSPQYVRAFYNTAKELKDVDASLFKSEDFWNSTSLFIKIEKHYKKGIVLNKLNNDLYKQCQKEKYDLVFFYGSSLIYAKTVKKIKSLGSAIFIYCNDNPFSKWYKPYVWKNLRESLKYCDRAYAYRESDIEQYKKYGAQQAGLLKSYYMAERNYYIPDEKIDLYVPDVVYIGHYEKDGREDYIRALLDDDIKVGLNHSWEGFETDNQNVVRFDRKISMEHYNEILNKAKIAIVFLSSINKDSYTRRCYEIPAVKTLMVSQYTDTIAEMYKEDEEIIFFRNKEEFLSKIHYYSDHPDEAQIIAQKGYDRLVTSKNEVSDRVKQVLNDYIRDKK